MKIQALYVWQNDVPAPQLAVAWDADSVDGWFDGWEQAKRKAIEDFGGETYIRWCEVVIAVPDGRIEVLFDLAVVPATVEPA